MAGPYFRQSRFLFLGMVLPFIAALTENRSLLQTQNSEEFTSYTDTIPGSQVTFEMIAVPGGKFLMGSPETEKNHQDDEVPVHRVKLDSFWMGKHEITWDEYDLFVYAELEEEQKAISENVLVDAVTRPTPPFMDMSFGMGKHGYPAVNMTQYAALSYCKWLTYKTGDFYRLPTEAEWEYACRAGSKTAFSFGDDINLLGEYAWYDKNSGSKYHKVGTKKPNQWNLHDMHGNVAEWTLDQYIPQFYASLVGKEVVNPWAEPVTLYPQSVRGGSWDDGHESLRSAARRGSSARWKKRDPQIPKSDWWNTDASFTGFRIVRPFKQPTAEQVARYFAAPLKDY